MTERARVFRVLGGWRSAQRRAGRRAGRRAAPAAPAAPAGFAALAALALLLAAAGCGEGTGGGSGAGTSTGTATGTGAGARGGGAPTVVLVSIDTLRADRLGCYGRNNAQTPNIDRLAIGGALFMRAQTSAPITLPAHASLMTGRSLPGHGVNDNLTYVLPPEIPALAESFKKGGYATGAFVSAALLGARYGLARGFDRYDDAMPKAAPTGGAVFNFGERPGRATVDQALSWLATQQRAPAFLWVHLWEPHAPYTAPREFAALFPGDPYQAEVAAVDAAVGQLVDGIAALRGDGKLLVVVVGDHGEALGEHGEQTHGIFLYQATMHVPFVVHGPGWGVKAGRVEPPVGLVDVMPTLLDLAKLPTPGPTDGVSLAPVLAGTAPAPPAGHGLLAESHVPRIEHGWSGIRAYVDGDLKLIDAPRPELYDLASDPRETRNLVEARTPDATGVRTAMTDHLRRSKASAPSASAKRSATEEEIAMLNSLGYASSGRPDSGDDGPLVDPKGVDPKDRIAFITQLDTAMAMVQSGKAPAAVPMLRALRKQEPENVSVLTQLGQGLILTGALDEALAVFRETVRIAPAYGLGWHRIGQLLDHKKDLAGAEQAYQRAIETDPLDTTLYKALAGILDERGRTKEAVTLLEHAQRIDPADTAIPRDLAAFKAKLP